MYKPRAVMLALIILLLVLGGAACSRPPETQVYIVLTPTHQPPTLTALAVEGVPVAGTPQPEGTPRTIASAVPLPTPLVTQIQVAEQVFEHGRMFWLQPTREIWVMLDNGTDSTNGQWLMFPDTFEEGEVEIDPELTPPADTIQPRRGFGKLWRENAEIREAIGWATGQEYGFISTYEYRAGGYLDSSGAFVPQPGIHLLTSLGNNVFAFEETDSTWRLVQ